jgi:hypothetical protein
MGKEIAQLEICKSCGHSGAGNFCAECGQTYKTKRITLSGLLHDVFHFFTHLEKGFGYTLKRLIIAPGTMQREYVEGVRSRYQKPFSMFFICASINALARYWIFESLFKLYHWGNTAEANFFHQYMVLLYTIIMPVIVLITWLFFFNSKYNYAETGVLQLYIFSFIFLMVAIIALLKFIWHDLDTAYVELPAILVYCSVTCINFYRNSNKWITVVKSVVLLMLIFYLAQKAEDIWISLVK